MLDSLIVQHQAKRLFAQPASAPATTTPAPVPKSNGKRRASR